MRGGQNRKPTYLKVAQGTFRKDRALGSEFTPEPMRKVPPAPSDLNAEGKAVWARSVKALEESGILVDVDLELLHAYCAACQTWKKLWRKFKDSGYTVAGMYGAKLDPEFKVMQDARSTMEKLAAHFGFSPQARTRVSGKKREAQDPMEALMMRAKGKIA